MAELSGRIGQMEENMAKTDVFSWLSEYLEEEFDIAEIQEDDGFMNELALSSLDVFNMIADLEYDFDIKVSEKLIREMITVRDMVDVIGRLLES